MRVPYMRGRLTGHYVAFSQPPLIQPRLNLKQDLNQGFHDSKFNWDLLCEDVHHFLSWTVPETNSDKAPFKKCW